MHDEELRWGRFAALYGVLAGLAIAVGLPYIVLVYGKHLSGVAHTIIIILALLGGGTVTVISVFLGIVIPRKISERTDLNKQVSAPRELKETKDSSEKNST